MWAPFALQPFLDPIRLLRVEGAELAKLLSLSCVLFDFMLFRAPKRCEGRYAWQLWHDRYKKKKEKIKSSDELINQSSPRNDGGRRRYTTQR